MEQKQTANVSSAKNDERYQKFAERERQFATEIGMPVEKLAREGKGAKEREFERNTEYIERYKQEAERLREDIDLKKKGIINKVINFKQIKELKAQLHRNEVALAKTEEEQRWRDEMIGYYDQIIKEEELMGELMEEAQRDDEVFNVELKAQTIEEEEQRSVVEQAKKHGVFFVSDIIEHAERRVSENNKGIDTKELSFEEQLNLVLGLEPTLSVSTVSPDSKNRTFSIGSCGVLLAGGRIVGGEETDAGTRALGLRNREIASKSKTAEAINKAIERPLGGGKEAATGYNELSVERPEVAGLYFKMDSSELEQFKDERGVIVLPKDDYGNVWWERVAIMQKTGAPIFVFEQDTNNIRMVTNINPQTQSFNVTEAYDPINIVDMPAFYNGHRDDAHRRKAVTYVFDKVAHLLPEEERVLHEKEKDKGNSDNLINVYR